MAAVFAGPIGLIINVRSQRNRERLERLRAVYRSADNIVVRELAGVSEIPAALEEFEGAGATLIAVSGGDGTIQATMTAILSEPGSRERPLAVLAGGMTNVIGHQVGISGKPDRGLAALLARRKENRELRLVRHPVMGIRVAPDAERIYGMLLGGAGFHDGVMMARKRVHPVGFAQSAAAGIGAAVYYLRTLLGGAGTGHSMSLTFDSSSRLDRRCYLLLVTCLPGLMLGLDPFWGEGTAPLRWTWVDHPPRRLAIAAGPLLFGKPLGWMLRCGYYSGRASHIEIESSSPLLLDGERIESRPGNPIVVDGGYELIFARF